MITLAVIASGVKQQPFPVGEMDSQLPPLAVATDPLNRIVELSIVATLKTSAVMKVSMGAMMNRKPLALEGMMVSFKTCGSGLTPPNGMVKLMGFNWINGAVPTVTVTGMVVASPVVWKTS